MKQQSKVNLYPSLLIVVTLLHISNLVNDASCDVGTRARESVEKPRGEALNS